MGFWFLTGFSKRTLDEFNPGSFGGGWGMEPKSARLRLTPFFKGRMEYRNSVTATSYLLIN